MADNFNMKQFLMENKLGAYSKLKEAEEKEEGYMGTQYDSSEDRAVDMLKKGITEASDSITVLRDLYYFDKLNALAAKEDVDEKYYKYGTLWAKKGDTISSDEDEYDMIMKSSRLKKGKDYNTSVKEDKNKEEQFAGINEKIDPYDQFIKTTKTGKELQPFHPKMKYGFKGYRGKENIKAKDMSSQKLTGAGYYRMSDDEFKKYQDLGLDSGSARVPFKLEGLKQFAGINEDAIRDSFLSPEAYERMAGLTSITAQQAMIKAAEVMMRELTDEGFEVEEIREFFHILISNDI